MSKPRTYAGQSIEVSFDASRCIHARNCWLKLPSVFDPDRRPWIDPDAAPAEEIAAMVRTCPSGALTYKRLDGAADESPAGVNRATLKENGPLGLEGKLAVDGASMTRATICRCGQSQNMPYCDGSHAKAGFTATGEPEPTGKDAPGDTPNEAVTLIPHENGPVEAQGALEITAASGTRLHRGTRAFLCRCGLSKNKPFCDGSHKDGGFVAPGPKGG